MVIDKLIVIVEGVSVDQWQTLRHFLSEGERLGYCLGVTYWIGKSVKDYHHNLRVGEGEGAITYQWKHNSSSERESQYKFRMETNPQKNGKGHEWAKDVFRSCFSGNKKMIKGFDLAHDVEYDTKDVIPISVSGKDRHIVKGTIYYGQRGKDGYLKRYDKKKEREDKGFEVDSDYLTRIEYSARFRDPVTIQQLKGIDLRMNEQYKIYALESLGEVDPTTKAYIIAVHITKMMEWKEVPRRQKEKIKKALADMVVIDLDHEYNQAVREIQQLIKNYITLKEHA